MNFVRFSLKYPQVTISVLVIVFALGAYSLFTMPRREDPKITVRQGLVLAFFPGANSSQVEDQLTRKVEETLFQFSEVRKGKTFSTSRDGLMIIQVELEEWVQTPDMFWNKLTVALQITKQTELPPGIMGPMVNSDFGDTEAIVLGITSKKRNYRQLKEYTRQLEDKLRGIRAVSKMKRIGERQEEIVITSNSEKLAQYGIKFTDVIKILQSQNNIYPSGNLKTDATEVPFYTTSYYNTEEEIARQVVGTAKNGDVIHLGDIARIERRYEEADSYTAVNSIPAMMLSLQMQEGNNIVDFGEEVGKKIAEMLEQLPSDVDIVKVIDQPALVDHNISHFIREFFIAITAVVIVILVLLPFRIALVAAMAIPMTIAMTFAMLHAFGIELHQVSLAALIVVLGMVVDDAIVIADNYVELLDEGMSPSKAAWRSATDLVIPVLTATITIIAAFIPMIILSGSVGEFILALPLTVTIALASSFLVAMIFTPILCYAFIKKGLHQDGPETAPDKKPSMLDRLQNVYDKSLDWCMAHHRITVSGSLFMIVIGVALYFFIPQKFFPAAERNQFVIDLWMPTGTTVARTEAAIQRMAGEVAKDERVTSYAVFTGSSAPRFYYNFSPEVPATNFAQILVNTTDDAAAQDFAQELTQRADDLIPEGRTLVRLMQQGTPYLAPVEIRISGDELATIKQIGDRVVHILEDIPGSINIRDNFHEDYYGIDIQLKPQASRLGFTTESVAKTLYVGFSGAPVSTMYEGSTPVDLVLRLSEESRKDFNQLENTYLPSPVTGSSVPLRQIATLSPQWYTGRIVRRNGVRTLSILSENEENVLPEQVLSRARKEIDKMELPAGYQITYGGEYENKQETFSQMVVALGISIVLIFLILLIQFRNLKETFLVMLTIPLSLFGAFLGLLLTGNNFGFTAFVGLISLSGVVVRNAIILIDHTNELLAKGDSIPEAAIEAGKRRLRPIFLTATAAAFGVLPMILSGSPMWSPLASVLAVGVIWSMIMALLTIPILYALVIKPKDIVHPVSNEK
ncbi:efflux RND transporter permease subunit [Sinomicrobium pectinilyticum]|uniref:Efflux RND transporter permease subunit n=1 Tax=Sinomicrobium pectinilyticum TaxID=1084421 RepID=A0A3N0EEP3_SINP1|nr:efflux RND transporter permease subunit [Sinomicrobium pectinilyticum]RNL86291.1 efflux RND transporter permease subunit [Sinomicrobium pectinilyticum]